MSARSSLPIIKDATPPHSNSDTSKISGNASANIKRMLGDVPAIFTSYFKPEEREYNGFGRDVQDKMIVTELSVLPNAEDPSKMEGRAVFELDVSQDTHLANFNTQIQAFFPMSTPAGTNRPTKATSSPPHLDISRISGNASEEIKRTLGNIPAIFATYIKCGRYTGFGKAIKERMMVTELSIIPKAEEPLKLEGRAVIEIDVMEDMVNAEDNIHGGCLAFLIDV
uniref:Uncharacterized protein n=1 Tax=Psilocybe cubensis TaxID=181762 RepID=A0A8H7XW49_PSICU